MKAECPNCGVVYQIDDSKIPDKGAYATCAKCRTRFHIKSPKVQNGESKQEIITCPNCGHQQPKSAECEKCEIVFDKFKTKTKFQKQRTKDNIQRATEDINKLGSKIFMNDKQRIIFIFIIITILASSIAFYLGRHFPADKEKIAKASLYEAQKLIRDGKEEEGEHLLEKITRKYAETTAATEANKILNARHATEGLVKIFKKETIENYNKTAKYDLMNCMTAQEAYFIDNQTYSKSIEQLIGSEYGLSIADGVRISIKHADRDGFVIESFHKKGNQTYVATRSYSAGIDKIEELQ